MGRKFDLLGYSGERYSAEQWCYECHNKYNFDIKIQVRRCVDEKKEEIISCQKIPYLSLNKYKQSLSKLDPTDKIKLYFNNGLKEELTKTNFIGQANDGDTILPHWIILDIDFDHKPLDLTDGENDLFNILRNFDEQDFNYILFGTEEGRGIKILFSFKELQGNKNDKLKQKIGSYLASVAGEEYKPEIKLSGSQCSFCYPAKEGEEPIHAKTNKPIKILHFKGWENSLESVKSKINEIEKSKGLSDYIWDESEVVKNKVFPMDLFDDIFFYGLLLPQKSAGKQVLTHCLITSNGDLIKWDSHACRELGITFGSIPSFLPQRWKLNDIKNFLDNKVSVKSPEELFNKIELQYKEYLSIRNSVWYKIHSLWDIGTYLYQIFEAYPFFELRGLAGTAKTKSMTISSYISFNGGQIMVNPSEATLFREKDEIRGTSYFDEAEKLWVFNRATKQWEGDVRTELINASYTKEAKVPRQEKIRNRFFTKWYSPYGPTQLSSISGLYGATETRAITRITTKSPQEDERGEREPTEERNSPIWEEIRNDCYIFGLTYWRDVQKIYLNFPKDTGLKRRDLQIWKPLLSLAKFISEDLFNEIIQFAKDITKRRTDDLIPESSFDHGILHALKICLERENPLNKIYVNEIKNIFCKGQNESDSFEDKYLNRNISSHLDKIGFKELRDRDRKGSFFEVNKKIYNEIVAPICPELAFESTFSSQSAQPTQEIDVEVIKVTMSDENDNTFKENSEIKLQEVKNE